jgi:hypothetical protein
MRKERAKTVKQDLETQDTITRTTCFLSEAQDYNLDVLALHSGKSKGYLIREGIAMVLKQYGFPENDRVEIQIAVQSLNSDQQNGLNGHPGSRHRKEDSF